MSQSKKGLTKEEKYIVQISIIQAKEEMLTSVAMSEIRKLNAFKKKIENGLRKIEDKKWGLRV